MKHETQKEMLAQEIALGLTEEQRSDCDKEEAKRYLEMYEKGEALPKDVRYDRKWDDDEQEYTVKFYKAHYKETDEKESERFLLLKSLQHLEKSSEALANISEYSAQLKKIDNEVEAIISMCKSMYSDIRSIKDIVHFWFVLTIIGLSVAVLAALISLFILIF